MFFRNYFNNLVIIINNKLRIFQSIPLNDKYNSKNNFIRISIIILLFFNFILLGINGINAALDPQWFDTTAYLGEANFINHHGGVLNFFSLCITGIYKQANQHPLYILFLTPFASMDISFFIVAKIISAILGFILLIALFFIGKKMYGDLIASVAVFALLLNSLFLKWTTVVACESLLMLFSLLCIYFVMEGFKNNKYWIYAGFFAGLSYLTKGTGILLLPGFVLTSIIVYKLNIFKNKFFWLFFILFTLTASPLLIRNIFVYQNPFYNVNNTVITMGQDEIDKSVYVNFDLKEGVAIWKFEKSETNNEGEIKSKSSQQKFSSKLFSLPKKIIEAGLVFLDMLNISWAQKLPSKLLKVFTLFLVLFFIIGIVKEKNTGGKLYFLSTILVFFLALFTMPIDRYFLPLIPVMWIYVALGTFTILDLLNKNFSLKYYNFNLASSIPYILILFLILNAGFILTKKDIKNPLSSVVYSESRFDLLNWLRANLKKDDLYTMGPNFNWQLEKGTWVLPPRVTWADFSKFQSFVKKHNISYAIIDSFTLSDLTNPFDFTGAKIAVNREKSIESHFAYDTLNGITEKKRVGGWNLIYKDQKKPTDFLVYKLTN